jgi:hypothetical protein
MRNLIHVRARCPRCGPVVVDGGLLECELEPGSPVRGLCELSCPSCSQPILFSTAPAVMETLFKAGAKHIAGAVPFELLEAHDGPPLAWDDLLDFKLALENWPWPQRELDD